jgi:hypothetical protein
MSTLVAQAPNQSTVHEPAPLFLERRHALAALAILFVFFVPYQTLVQTVITDDAVARVSRRTIMTWSGSRSLTASD